MSHIQYEYSFFNFNSDIPKAFLLIKHIYFQIKAFTNNTVFNHFLPNSFRYASRLSVAQKDVTCKSVFAWMFCDERKVSAKTTAHYLTETQAYYPVRLS